MFEDFFRLTSQSLKHGFSNKLRKLEQLYTQEHLTQKEEHERKKRKKNRSESEYQEIRNLNIETNGQQPHRLANDNDDIDNEDIQREVSSQTIGDRLDKEDEDLEEENQTNQTFTQAFTQTNSNSLVYKHFVVKKRGYEILPTVESKFRYSCINGNPYTYTIQNDFSNMIWFREPLKPSKDSTFLRTHMKIMSNLLYVAIMQRNFNAAYHAYCKIMKLYLRKFTTSSVEENTVLKETNWYVDFHEIWSIGLYILRNYENCETNEFILSDLEFSELELINIYKNENCDLYTFLNSTLMNRRIQLESKFLKYNIHLIQRLNKGIDNKYTQFWKWLITFKASMRYNSFSKQETKNLSLTIISSFLWFNLNEIDATEKIISILKNNFLVYEVEAKKEEEFQNDQPIIALEDIRNGYNLLRIKFRKLKQAINSYLLEAFFVQNQILNYIKLLTILLQLKFEIFNHLYDIDIKKQNLTEYFEGSMNSWDQKTILELITQFVTTYDIIAKDKLFETNSSILYKYFENLKAKYFESQQA